MAGQKSKGKKTSKAPAKKGGKKTSRKMPLKIEVKDASREAEVLTTNKKGASEKTSKKVSKKTASGKAARKARKAEKKAKKAAAAQGRESVWKRRWRVFGRRTFQITFKLILLAAAAIALNWLLEYRHFMNDVDTTYAFIETSPLVFWYTCLIMFTILMFFYGIFRKPFITIGTVMSLVLIIGYIHMAKFNFRGAPLLPEDLQLGSQAGTLTKFVDGWDITRLVLAVICTITLGIILDHVTRRWLYKGAVFPGNVWWRRYMIVSRIAIIAVAVTGFMVTTEFARHHTAEREQELEFLESKFTDWDQVTNYRDNGFIIGFLYNLNKLDTVEPDGYSKERIAEIKAELSSEKKADTGRTETADIDYNIVVILNESFYDPKDIREYYPYSGGDVTPNLHRLQQTDGVFSGTMYSVDYGGGTANIEYEVLTGLTTYWLKTVPYINFIPKQTTVPSLASFAVAGGLEARALHPFNGGMYKRDIVLPKLGFQEFKAEEDFTHTDTYGYSEYVTDGEAYTEMIETLKKYDKPQMISLITMQNHAPYYYGEYGQPQFLMPEVPDVDERNAAETYLMTLNKSDEYLGQLYDAVQRLDEKTVVLFYGDHSPGVFPRVAGNTNAEVMKLSRQTPYLIFANFTLDGTEEKTEVANAPAVTSNTGLSYTRSSVLATTRASQPGVMTAVTPSTLEVTTPSTTAEKLPMTTPNCLSNTLLNILNAEKPEYYYLLDRVCKEQPILTETYFGSEAPFMSTTLSEYSLITYDLVAGEQYYLK